MKNRSAGSRWHKNLASFFYKCLLVVNQKSRSLTDATARCANVVRKSRYSHRNRVYGL
jgi:hypothetical protein